MLSLAFFLCLSLFYIPASNLSIRSSRSGWVEKKPAQTRAAFTADFKTSQGFLIGINQVDGLLQ